LLHFWKNSSDCAQQNTATRVSTCMTNTAQGTEYIADTKRMFQE